MCGLVGKINLQDQKVNLTDIKKMTDAIHHRGPDDEGVWAEGPVGLGSRRLAIIDLSKRGHMPMFYAHNRFVIVFNGEIYNFQAEKSKLEKLGFKFRSHSDTEVVLALYQQYGARCLDHLRGMFALAIYDRREKTLFAARDRLGKKPFKYYFDGNSFIFGSELKAILTQKEAKKEVDYLAIHHYLTYQYVPAPLTGFKNISKLPAAHYLILKGGKLTIKRYWQLDYRKSADYSVSEWTHRIWDMFLESTKLRLISDVPLGAFLSGGIDSSAVVAAMSQLNHSPIKTFSIGFDEASHDETYYADIVARQFATDHTKLTVKPDAIDILPKLAYHYEEPYADSSAIPTYYLSKLTREHVTVALNGDGGDENFAGYGRYNALLISNYSQLIPAPLRRTLLPFFARELHHLHPSTWTERGVRFSNSLNLTLAQRYLQFICYFTNQQKLQYYTKDFAALTSGHDSTDLLAHWLASAPAKNALDQVLYADIVSYLPDDLLVKVDIASMANSLEGRSPFLDHKFMELTSTIPASLKIKNFNRKYILKRTLRGILPDEILDRPKMGFGVPIEHWFRKDLKKFVKDTLLSPRSTHRRLIRPEAIKAILDQHNDSNINHANHIWALLSLEYWFREYVD